jgi:hypothetical protein
MTTSSHSTTTPTPPATAAAGMHQAGPREAAAMTRPAAARGGASALDVVGARFTALCTHRPAVVVDGTAVGHGLPARPIPLPELRSMLLHPSTSPAARDAALAAVLRLAAAGADDDEWPLVLLGLLLPGLRHAAGRLLRAFPHVEGADLLGELVTGVLAALPGFDPAAGRVAGRLLAQGVVAARRYGRAQTPTEPLPADDRCPTARGLARAGHTAAPDGVLAGAGGGAAGHPDFVLARAVRAEVISTGDAELIGRSRLEGDRLLDLAVELGIAYPTARRRRARAEHRLVAWLTGDTDEEELPS